MKKIINKITNGSKLLLFLEILIVVQLVVIICLIMRNNSIDEDTYCSEHGYQTHEPGGLVVERSGENNG